MKSESQSADFRKGMPHPLPVILSASSLAAFAEAAKLVPMIGQLGAGERVTSHLERVLAGIEAYQSHPWQRPAPGASLPVIWRQGSARILDYGPGDGRPLLVVPSLINGPEILDLMPEHSLLMGLRMRGVRCLLLDWGEPGAAETALTLDDVIVGRLLLALRDMYLKFRQPISVLGHCMGGTLSAAVLALAPGLIGRFVGLASPWDFDHLPGLEAMRHRPEEAQEWIRMTGTALGHIPAMALQALFTLRDPAAIGQKFADFAAFDPRSPKALLFVAVEDWLSCGRMVPAPVVADILRIWLADNDPARGRWQVAGRPLSFAETGGVPALIVSGHKDRIAPHASVAPLAAALPRARSLSFDKGHIGMIIGRSARQSLWQPLADFLMN